MSPLSTAPTPAPAQEAELRTRYLSEVLGVLYPAGPGDRELLVLPHAGRPRLLVPAGSARLAAAAVRHCTEPRSGRARLTREAAAVALRTGLGRLLRDRVRVEVTGSVEHHLREALGCPVAPAIHIGPARANRKPVAQLLDPAGGTVGFTKVGMNRLTRRLVRVETAALRSLAHRRLRQITPPQVRYAGQWGEHPLLVQSAVPVWRQRTHLRGERLAMAMHELACSGEVACGPLATSRYWHRLVARVDEVTIQSEGAVLAAAVATLGRRAAGVELRYGTWHGDWAPWNMAVLPETLLVWDWERFDVDVPVGFDAVHYDLQRRLAGSPDAAAAVAATVDAADRLLAPFDVAPAARGVTALLYLADLATRYLSDRQAQAGARLGVLGTWLLPVLTRHLEELS